jgi:replication factor A2
VTIKQIIDATQSHPEASYQIDGADIGSVYCVGQVRNISTQSTNITYKIDDGTGEIEAKQWVDSTTARMDDDMDVDGTTTKDDSAASKSKVELNGFVKVFGKLKVFGNKRFLGAHNVRPLTNLNELHTHFLEATAVHLFFQRGPPPSANAGVDGGFANPGAKAGALGGGQDDHAAGARALVLPTLSPAARRMYNLLKGEPPNHEGLHAQNISAKIGLPSSDVVKAGDELVAAGLLYSTVDDFTWAILE